mmetsp:Transcript_8803/g.18959  ORF Transcript_8803/g.18959 Transcript_8803/m.18959 type:complete len:90 (+) Transcript_8803:901-1170(+)
MLLKFMTLASLARGVEMQRDKQTCDASNENYNVAWAQDDEKVHSLLTNFMTWASLTRDVEMQRGVQSCFIDAIRLSALLYSRRGGVLFS